MAKTGAQQSREYRAKHPEKIRERNASWYARNKQKAIAASKAYGNANKNRRRGWMLKRRYGMSLDQYDQMLAAQGRVCAICSTSEAGGVAGRFHVDHDHATGRVRGLLCYGCNIGLGSFRDSPDTLRLAASYLQLRAAK